MSQYLYETSFGAFISGCYGAIQLTFLPANCHYKLVRLYVWERNLFPLCHGISII
jgi:hypothetical protein